MPHPSVARYIAKRVAWRLAEELTEQATGRQVPSTPEIVQRAAQIVLEDAEVPPVGRRTAVDRRALAIPEDALRQALKSVLP